MALAVKLLGLRDHSAAELTSKLAARSYPAETIDAVIARLTALGYLDDRHFARRWAECAVENGRGYGRRLRFELQRRGIDPEIIAEVLEDIGSAYDEGATLAALMASKYPTFDPKATTDRDTRRIVNFLQRRGFSGEAIRNFFRGGHDR